jgi:predicted esterase
MLIPLVILGTWAGSGCNNIEGQNMITGRDVYRQGRLTAKPQGKTTVGFKTGLHPLNIGSKRDGLIYIPKSYNNKPAPLAVMLHGAGGNAESGLSLLKNYADENNIILLAPASRNATWDVIYKDAFDDDVIFIDQALRYVFENYNVDTNHLAVGGFSDGASYALSIGLSNGDLFTHIIAFSPGFSYTIVNMGKPAVYISHGVNDRVLPIDPCSRRIVPKLKKSGYEVLYKEFDGEHQIPAAISASAISWFKHKV